MLVVLTTNKNNIKKIKDFLKLKKLQNKNYRIEPTKEDPNKYLIPLRENINEAQTLQILTETFDPSDYVLTTVPLTTITKSKKIPGIGLTGENLRDFLEKKFNWSRESSSQIPTKWVRYGHVIVLYANSDLNLPPESIKELLEAFRERLSPDIACLISHVGKIKGELRQPQMKNLIPESNPIALHVENKIKYKFDVTKIMFAPGNGTERTRASKIRFKSGEILLDMFAGLGYFSIPMAKNNLEVLDKVICIEKNPDSFRFLVENLELNGVSEKVVALCGDNRTVGEMYLGKCDRVLMGYLPNTRDFLIRALDFANPNGSVLYYHHLCGKKGGREVALKDFEVACCGLWEFKVLEFVKVKSYGPKVFHCVADVWVKKILNRLE
eukprot:TRINITY_DN8571_c0_g1_i2.p1 TRINITY_DN8571_c0_g1~~TRINITY_DN8571_c0_g1_i2.p1  ORF type:complete len:382 (-),score=68.05 TRINITY_DN8571_c0_g1_i2:32-1177(-)